MIIITRDEHKAIVTELISLLGSEHQARGSELLTNLTEDYEEVLTGSESFESEVTKLKENNESLRRVNADLFLKVGSTLTNKPPTSNNEDAASSEDETKELKFEDLFDEKGELK